MTETVKVQRPIFPPNGPWLIYDRDRKHMVEVDSRAIPQYVRDQMRDDHKAYFIGAWSSVVGWGLSNRVSDDQEFLHDRTGEYEEPPRRQAAGDGTN